MGLQLQTILKIILKKRIYLIPLFSFIVFIILIYLFNAIYLDHDEVIVSTTVANMNFKISGEAITQICRNFGSATVFAVGARIAAGLVAKHPMGLISKIGGTGAGFTITYRVLLESFNQRMNQSHGNVSISGTVHIQLGKIEHLNKNCDINDLLINTFNPENYLRFQFRKETSFNF